MKGFARSDLASECTPTGGVDGVRQSRAEVGGCQLIRTQIKTEAAAAALGKPCGKYVTLCCGNIGQLEGRSFENACRVLSVEVRELAEQMTHRRIGRDFSVLVVGLGNGDMTPDAIGPATVRTLTVTRHLRGVHLSPLAPLGLCEISALAPGTSGQTGLELAELVRGTVQVTSPDLVLAVDALAAREASRLAATVQLTDTGIHPGSGVGAARCALNRDTVGAPVLAIGVPTVVEISTLLFDLMESVMQDAAITARCATLLSDGRGLLVAPGDIDLLVAASAQLLAAAIEKAFSN